ncbi:MAG: alpha-2-macroglobulin [Betaproteobacteria bacterium]|nr:alpha-2-macroglobulin [Betaproteobacteria bacterium]
MNILLRWSLAAALAASPQILFAAETARVEFFSPRGTVKGVRQVTARFSDQMVPFGDPRLVEPFDIQCPAQGTARWADGRNWIYDFEHDLPAGVRCSFVLKTNLKTLAGNPVAAERSFMFSTGGPAVLQMLPYEGSESIDEEQVFILGLDAPASEASILKNVYCESAGANERIGVRLISGGERAAILDQRRQFVERYFDVLFKTAGGRVFAARMAERGTRQEQFLKLRDGADSPLVALQCKLRLPNGGRMTLVWGRGVASLPGIPTEQDQRLAYKTRGVFRARFSCTRVNKDAQCIPVLPMGLEFTAPIARADAQKMRLRSELGGYHRPRFSGEDERGDFVVRVEFAGPFPEQTRFWVHLPEGLRDDAGRPLANAKSFPLAVRTDENPPLAKFAAPFGVIELKAGALLPVTLRNVEPRVAAAMMNLAPGKAADMGKGEVKASVLAADTGSAAEIVRWLRRLRQAGENVWEYDAEKKRDVIKFHAGSKSVFTEGEKVRRFVVPKPGGRKAFEVVGIPLKRAGFYVVELASPRLGAALLGEKKPYYVQSAALVTNLAAHLKLGRESSLVWVTALDSGKPAAGAEVEVLDCSGKTHWGGKTDQHGIARIAQALPPRNTLPPCLNNYHRQYFVRARAAGDMTFAFSDWNEGIAPWRFALPRGEYDGPYIATTVFDRTLLRAGETVHMKHLVRTRTRDGFEFVKANLLDPRIVIRHLGSDQRYELPVKWDARASAESTWTIPKDAKQGVYQLYVLERFSVPAKTRRPRERLAGSFRVEAFRVPTMKAVMKPPRAPLVNAASATVDVQVNYLAGGGAGNAPVKLRSLLQPKTVSFPDYEGFVFGNGNVREGAGEARADPWRYRDYLWADAEDEEAEAPPPAGAQLLATQSFNLDHAGGGRAVIRDLPKVDTPHEIVAELEYRDAAGETLASSARVALWPANVLLGIKPDSWAVSKDNFRFQVMAVDLAGKPAAGVAVKVDLFQRHHYSHRKRLIGGFYAYETFNEVKRVGDACQGVTNARGLVFCEGKAPVSGNVILRAQGQDRAGNAAYANRELWIAGSEDWWFDVKDSDRMDVLPERKRYEPGETAVFQVRMPFREATALVTVEREGVIESFVTPLSGKAPVVKLPIRGHYAPNVFVSVLALRGRVADAAPTALIDLGKPAFKLGIAEINVGWRAHELKVSVATDRQVYQVRDKARVAVSVKRADGSVPPRGTEVALAAVDEGLLELLPNDSWKLLDAMMKRRGIEVETATAQMHVVGKRHFGRKALPQGGGGGRQSARELFDTLLFWQGRVTLDENGAARVTVPLNDSLTAFRIVAVADGEAGLFGTGQSVVRSTQDVMLLSGLPPLVRERDRFRAGFTVRNATDRALALEIVVKLTQRAGNGQKPVAGLLAPQTVRLAAGEAREIGWEVTAPVGAEGLSWEVTALDKARARAQAMDAIRVTQKVTPAVAVRTFQATLVQLEKPLDVAVEMPADAIPGRGGVRVSLRARLADELAGVREYMSYYPYTCLEQLVSQAVALRDENRWKAVMASLPSYLDRDGLAKFFPALREGSDTLTAYVMAIAHEARWEIPEAARTRMERGLRGFVEGRVVRHSELPTADTAIRKIAALDALSRGNPKLEPRLLESISLEPNLWPTSAVIDWYGLLARAGRIPDRQARLKEAESIIRARLNFQGTTMGFSTERSDFLWWLLVSGDVNANRAVLALLDNERWREDMPRLVRGTLGRMQRGRWNTTVANAWGVLAIEKFSAKFEAVAVAGTTAAELGGGRRELDWKAEPRGGKIGFDWPRGRNDLSVRHSGSGRPWVTVQSLAAIPLKQPFATGYKVTRTVTPVEQKVRGAWSRGDVLRVRLDLEAQSDMTWVVVRDPIPAGAAILGTGLGGDARVLARGERRRGWVWPAFEERTFDSFRAYYRFVPKGRWVLEYTVRLNNPGRFELPETRVEAMYAPEMFAETPNAPVEVKP